MLRHRNDLDSYRDILKQFLHFMKFIDFDFHLLQYQEKIVFLTKFWRRIIINPRADANFLFRGRGGYKEIMLILYSLRREVFNYWQYCSSSSRVFSQEIINKQMT